MGSHQLPALERWLRDHCESCDHVVAGLVVAAAARRDGARPVAQWPAGGDVPTGLATVAQAALQRDKPLVVAPAVVPAHAPHNRVISLPLRVGDEARGSVALAVAAKDSAALNALVKDLQSASQRAAVLLDAAPSDASASATAVLALQGALLGEASLAQGAVALVNSLAPALQCERVALGLVQGDAVEVSAISNCADISHEQSLVRALACAMQEAADQAATICYPARAGDPLRVILAHAEFHAQHGRQMVTVPLAHQHTAVGALVAEWAADAPIEPARVALLELLARNLGPLVALRMEVGKPWRRRLREQVQRAWRGADGQRGPVRLGVGAALLALAAALLWWPVTYRVGAPAHIEGVVQRVVAAPMDGFVHRTHVRPGDTVRAGSVLVELAEQDLRLEQNKLESTLAQHENAYVAALARADRAQFVIAQGRANEARAQLELVRQNLARTRMLAPIDGIVIKGDPGQALGAPVQRGDVLLVLAPADKYRLIVEVDERDVGSVRAGQRGQLALSALPAQRLDFTVERVTPVAVARDGRNAFEVQARLHSMPVGLRPGLQGAAKIDTAPRSLGWIWSHRVLDWLRVALWKWRP